MAVYYFTHVKAMLCFTSRKLDNDNGDLMN